LAASNSAQLSQQLQAQANSGSTFAWLRILVISEMKLQVAYSVP